MIELTLVVVCQRPHNMRSGCVRYAATVGMSFRSIVFHPPISAPSCNPDNGIRGSPNKLFGFDATTYVPC